MLSVLSFSAAASAVNALYRFRYFETFEKPPIGSDEYTALG